MSQTAILIFSIGMFINIISSILFLLVRKKESSLPQGTKYTTSLKHLPSYLPQKWVMPFYVLGFMGTLLAVAGILWDTAPIIWHSIYEML